MTPEHMMIFYMTSKNLAKLPLVGVAAVEGFVVWFEMFFLTATGLAGLCSYLDSLFYF